MIAARCARSARIRVQACSKVRSGEELGNPAVVLLLGLCSEENWLAALVTAPSGLTSADSIVFTCFT